MAKRRNPNIERILIFDLMEKIRERLRSRIGNNPEKWMKTMAGKKRRSKAWDRSERVRNDLTRFMEEKVFSGTGIPPRILFETFKSFKRKNPSEAAEFMVSRIAAINGVSKAEAERIALDTCTEVLDRIQTVNEDIRHYDRLKQAAINRDPEVIDRKPLRKQVLIKSARDAAGHIPSEIGGFFENMRDALERRN